MKKTEEKSKAGIFITLHGSEKISSEYMMADIEVLTVSNTGLLPNQDVVLSLGGKEQSLTTGITGRARNQLVFPFESNTLSELTARLSGGTAASASYPVVPRNYEAILSVQIREELSDQLKSKEKELKKLKKDLVRKDQEYEEQLSARMKVEESERDDLQEKYKKLKQKHNAVQQDFDHARKEWKKEEECLEQKFKETEQLVPMKVETRYNLRSKPMQITDQDVRRIYEKYNFFSLDNPQGFFPSDFVALNNDLVVDKATGLMWQRKVFSESIYPKDANSYIQKISTQKIAGYSDWRLPTLEEGLSILSNVKRDGYARHLSSPFKIGDYSGWWTIDFSREYRWGINSDGQVDYSEHDHYGVVACRSITESERSKLGL